MTALRRDGAGLGLSVGGVEVCDWRPHVEADGVLHPPSRIDLHPGTAGFSIDISFATAGLHLRLTTTSHADGGDTLILDGVLRNASARPVRLGRVYVVWSSSTVVAAGADDLLVLPQPGVISQRMVYRQTAPECPRSSKVKTLFYSPARKRALLVGFDSFGCCDTVVEAAPGAAGELTGLKASADFSGWVLGPGDETTLERAVVAAGPDPHRLLQAWADRAAACSVPRPRRWEDVPVGWLGWSWVDCFGAENYEEVMLRNCRAIRRRLGGHEIRYVWLSIGNLAAGSPGAWLEWNYETFPSGPEGLVAELGALGFRLGLWCGPFYISSDLTDLVERFDSERALLHRDGKRLVVCPAWSFGKHGDTPRDQRPCIYALDPSHPSSQAFIAETFAVYRRWGVRYYMIDFLDAGCGNVGPHHYDTLHDPHLVPGPEAYRGFLGSIREACGGDTYLLSSSGPTLHNVGWVDAVRTGNDFGEGRQIAPQSFFYPASYVINQGSFWTGPLFALRNQACSYYTHRKLFINDSGNVLTLDSPLPLEDARIHATIHTFGASPVMIGDDVDRMAPERVEILRKTLPRPRDVAFPVDLFDTPHPDHPKIFRRTVEKPWGRFDVVAVYNFGDSPLTQDLTWRRLGLQPGPHLVWEFWNQEYLGCFADGATLIVPPRAVRVLRLSPDLGRPCVLGTDMHLTMGETELRQVEWQPETLTLSGRTWRPANETGHLFIHAPEGLAVAQPRGLWIAKDGRDRSLIIKVALRFEGEDLDWSVHFSPISG